MMQFGHVRVESHLGPVVVLWGDLADGPRVLLIMLPNEALPVQFLPKTASCGPIAELAARLEAYLAGQPVDFDLSLLALDQCGQFQRRVLLAQAGIPRGWVSTYARIAAHLGAPQAARNVGMALACNPFPIVIPCHRTVRSDGSLGGYAGGLAMKRALLDMEGVAFENENVVRLDKVWY